MDVILKVVEREGTWEQHVQSLMKKYITKEDVCIDIGSHWGIHTELMCQLGKLVYSFEADKGNFEIQKENLKNYNNVILKNIGISDKNETVEWGWEVPGNSGSKGLSNNPMGLYDYGIKKEGVAHCIPLDLLQIQEKIKLIKIDVEGYESKVIKGAKELILKNKPIILLESWSDHRGGIDTKMLEKNIEPILPFYSYELVKEGEGDWLLLPHSS